ncbi:hypothetical protein, partial [Streptomyces sp. NPDC048665]|uniref:hypothetical protein n=1 Tax=Streptomyces sp. NPDC048665 TaxID=3155490 RepID=UPI0034397AFB
SRSAAMGAVHWQGRVAESKAESVVSAGSPVPTGTATRHRHREALDAVAHVRPRRGTDHENGHHPHR